MSIQQGRRNWGFAILSTFFAFFVVFLYGPTIGIILLSFQGPDGGLTFPLNGFSFHWFEELFKEQRVGDFKSSFQRSFYLALIVMILTVAFSLAAGLAYRKRFFGETSIFNFGPWRSFVPVGPAGPPRRRLRAKLQTRSFLNRPKKFHMDRLVAPPRLTHTI